MNGVVIVARGDARGEIAQALADLGIDALTARDAEDARARGREGALVVADVEGERDPAAAVRALGATTAVVVVDGARGVRDRLAVLRAGALDVLVRPVRKAELERALRGAGHPALLGDSEALRGVVERVEACARDRAPVLLRGERDTGAESFARLLHIGSERSKGPFVIAAGPIADAIMPALREAKGGTLFVDGAETLTPDAAFGLLRAHRDPKVDVRVVLAAYAPTAIDAELIARAVPMPPLRERLEDVPAMARHFARRPVRAKILAALQAHRWPGNLAELGQMVRGLVQSGAADQRASSQLRVPVRRDAVTITFGDGAKREAHVFRPTDAPIDTLLEGEERFVPIDEAGVVRLYARTAIACLTATTPHDGASGPIARRASVTVRLRSGAKIEGELRWSAPDESARAIDLLNKPSRTFAVHEGSLVHLVSKDHVEHLEEAR